MKTGKIIIQRRNRECLSPIVTELFLRGRKLEVFKIIGLNVTRYLIIKIPNKKQLQQITSNHTYGIDFEDFTKLYKDYTKEPHSF